MAWLQSETKLRNHPKLQVTAQELGITKVEMLGHLHLFWYWVLEYNENGNLKVLGDTEELQKQFLANAIAEGAEWKGDPIQLFDVLVKNKWIDCIGGQYRIHDWNDLSGKYAIQKEQAKERQKRYRERIKAKEDKDEFFNPNQMDRETEVWDEKTQVTDLAPADRVESSLSQTIFAALTRTIRGNWKNMTENERGRYNAATAQLVSINANPADIEIRFNHYIQAYGRKPTPSALVSHWGDLATQPINLSPKEREKLTSQKIKAMEQQDLDDWANTQ